MQSVAGLSALGGTEPNSRARELYDDQNGPGETVNLVARPDQQRAVLEMSSLLSRGWRAALPNGRSPQ